MAVIDGLNGNPWTEGRRDPPDSYIIGGSPAAVYSTVSIQVGGENAEADTIAMLDAVMEGRGLDKRTKDRIAIWFYEKYKYTEKFDEE